MLRGEDVQEVVIVEFTAAVRRNDRGGTEGANPVELDDTNDFGWFLGRKCA